MADHHSDRNLLIGILAVQLDFIDRDQLVNTMMTWVQDKTHSFDDLLLEKEFIDEKTRDILSALIEKHLEQHEGDPQKSLGAVSSIDTSLQQQLLSINDSGVEQSLSLMPTGRRDSPQVSSFGQPSTMKFQKSPDEGRYRILRPHARGGLGEVHVAFDSELNREVALKEIQDRHADQPESRARFVSEAEVTGGLEHPGIVPVYGLGNYANGRPFYAMRFIKGDSLKTAAEKFHVSGKQPPNAQNFSGLEFRKLLGRFVDVCQAIEYAHSRGVLHRDLKPGNIMLGKFGETLVVDWGLSKVIGREEPATMEGEATLKLSSGTGSTDTQHGTALGTPQFMPPEQASGRLDLLGPKSDVYSLGATLYFLLVGTPPIENGDVATILSRVQRGDIPTPLQKNPAIPRPLDAVCRKATQLEPENRFESVRELSDEIERWMADEPVRCYAEPISARLGRFVRRNQLMVAASTILLTSLTLGLVIISSIVSSKNAVLSQKNSRIEEDSRKIKKASAELSESYEKLKQLDLESKNRILAETRVAEVILERGKDLCEEGFSSLGVLYFAKALEEIPEQATELKENIQLILENWQSRMLQLQSFMKHDSNVTYVQFSHDSNLLLTASFDKTIRLWNAADGTPAGPKLKGTHQAEAAILLSDNRTVIMGCYDGTIRIFDGISGAKLGELDAQNLVRELLITSDESIAVARTNSGTLVLFQPKTGKVIEPATPLATGVSACDVHPEVQQIVVCQYKEKTISILEIPSGKEIRKLQLPESPNLAKFDPQGKFLIAVHGRPAIYESETLKPIAVNLPQRGVRKIDFHPKGDRFVTAGLDGQAIVFSVPGGRVRLSPLKHDGQVFQAKFNADGRLIVTTSNKTSQIWDARTGEKIGPARRDAGQFAMDRANQRIAIGSFDGMVKIWCHKSPLKPDQKLEMEGFVYAAQYHSAAQLLAMGGGGKKLKIWDFKIGLKLDDEKILQPSATVEIGANVGDVAIHPNGDSIAVGGWNRKIVLFDRQGNRLERLPMEHDSMIQTLLFSPDGTRLISGGDDSIAAIWDAETGSLIGDPILADGPVRSMAVGIRPSDKSGKSPSALLVVGGITDTPTAWDLNTGNQLFEMKHQPPPDSGGRSFSVRVAVSNDGKWIATGDNFGDLKLWNSLDGKLVWELDEFDRGFNSIEFSTDCRRLLVGGYDGIARQINVADGSLFGRGIIHNSAISVARYALDGKAIITGDKQGYVRISHTHSGRSISPIRKFNGEVTVALPIGPTEILAGHAMLRRIELVTQTSSTKNLKQRLNFLTGLRLDPDESPVILGAEQLNELARELKSENDSIFANQRVHKLTELANPITEERNRYSRTFTSFRLPDRK